jgi:hypothetical protein
MISPRELDLRLTLQNDFEAYAKACLKIRSKSGSLVPMVMNKAQLYIHTIAEKQRSETGRVRIIIVKGRQQGCSTYIEGRFYWRTSHRKGVKAFILTHEQEATNNLFEMARRFHDNCPELMKPSTGANSANELNFDRLDSGYKIGTAGNKAVGRSSTVQLLHSSELAYQPNAEEHAAGLLQAVPLQDETEVWFESTANGENDYFHRQWTMAVKGESDFIPIFIPWFWQDEYAIDGDFEPKRDELELKEIYGITNAQLHWRRKKIVELGGSDLGLLKFKKEYPMSAEEAFSSSAENKVIPPHLIKASVNRQVQSILRYKPIWGVDVGGEGANADRTALSKRQANTLLEPTKWWRSKDPMQVAGLILYEFDHTPVKPAKIYIDSIGIGAGVVSRLKEHPRMHGIATGINVAENDSVSETCWKMRDELWWRARQWFQGMDVKFPEECEALIQELQTPIYGINSAGKVVVESKKDMAKRGVRSVDLADSFNLTFAGPEVLFDDVQNPGSPHSHAIAYNPLAREHIRQDAPSNHSYDWTPGRN